MRWGTMNRKTEELLRAQAWMAEYWAYMDQGKKAGYRKASDISVRQDQGLPDYTESERGDNRTWYNLGGGCRRITFKRIE